MANMNSKFIYRTFCLLIFIFFNTNSQAQKTRAQYPPFLSNSYVSMNVGYINYPFSQKQLEPGFSSESVTIPHIGVRISLGHQFNKYLSFQIDYIRPVEWVQYNNINGDNRSHSVWMNIASLTFRGYYPIVKKLSVYGEVGFSLVTRHGFDTYNVRVKSATIPNVLFGAGLNYHIKHNWDLLFSAAYTPPSNKYNQPHSFVATAGFAYYFRPNSPEKVKEIEDSKYIFPRNVIQIGYTNDIVGFEANKNFTFSPSRPGIPIFWLGDIKVGQGISITYVRNIYHGRKIFSFDWGISASFWQSSINKTNVFTLAIFPAVKFWFLHSRPIDIYFVYSVAGPAFISQKVVDGINSGEHFTFQDFLGIGSFFGDSRRINFELRIEHFSNGNLFPANDGYAIPLTFILGYAF